MIKKKQINLIFWAYLIFIIVVTLIPNVHLSKKIGFGPFRYRLDHWLHLFAYFGMATVFIFWQMNKLLNAHWSFVFLTFTFCLAFAFFTEIIQFLSPGRNFSLKDFVTNSIGISGAFALFVLFRGWLRKTKFALQFTQEQ